MSAATVYLVSAPAPRSEAMAALTRELSLDEIARRDRFRAAGDAWNFVVGRALVRHALQRLFGLNQASIAIGAFGKPALAGGGPNFSIAHAGGIIACAVSRDFVVGVDVEPPAILSERDAIAADTFAPSEQALIAAAAPEGRDEIFTRVWTLKEAVVKATGLGPNLHPPGFAVRLDSPALLGGGPELAPFDDWGLAQTRLKSGRWLALALRGVGAAQARVRIEELHFDDLAAGG